MKGLGYVGRREFNDDFLGAFTRIGGVLEAVAGIETVAVLLVEYRWHDELCERLWLEEELDVNSTGLRLLHKR